MKTNTRPAAYRAAVTFLRRLGVNYASVDALNAFTRHLQAGRLIVARDRGDEITFQLH